MPRSTYSSQYILGTSVGVIAGVLVVLVGLSLLPSEATANTASLFVNPTTSATAIPRTREGAATTTVVGTEAASAASQAEGQQWSDAGLMGFGMGLGALATTIGLWVQGAIAKPQPQQPRLATMALFSDNPTGLVGDLAPTGFFDPLGLSAGKDEETLKQWREAEIKHGRVCMLASAGLLTQELVNNPNGVSGPAITHWDQYAKLDPGFFVAFVLICAFIEGRNIVEYWETAAEAEAAGRAAILKADSEPGDQGWDPLKFYPEDPEEQAIIRTKEIQNGRLAMLAVAGIVAQELVDKHTILCHFQKVCV